MERPPTYGLAEYCKMTILPKEFTDPMLPQSKHPKCSSQKWGKKEPQKQNHPKAHMEPQNTPDSQSSSEKKAQCWRV